MRRDPRHKLEVAEAAATAKTDGRTAPPPRPLEKTACAERSRHALRGLLRIVASARRPGSAETA